MSQQSCSNLNYITKHANQDKIPKQTINITFLIYCAVSVALTILYYKIQKTSNSQKASLTTIFNGGGYISTSLLAATIISQWTWAASLLQSTTVGTEFGVSGGYWYGAGACIQIILFSIIAIEFKLKAPGATTFLQFIYARFDQKTHIVYCVFAVLTNAIVAAMLLVGGVSILANSFEDLPSEYAIILFMVGMFSTIYKGLGGLIYVSYIGAIMFFLVILIMFVKVFYSGNLNNFVGSFDIIYNNLNCLKHGTNFKNSYKTFLSVDGLMFGIINIIGNFGTVFVDQSYWQLIPTTTPKKCGLAFIIAGCIWFSIPFCFSTTMSIGYLSLRSVSSANITHLTSSEISAGLVAPYLAQYIYGPVGRFLCNLIVVIAVCTTGSSEILAVTSIIVYDIYMTYIFPFRSDLKHKDTYACILCGKSRGKSTLNKCNCVSIHYCEDCLQDDQDMTRETTKFNNVKYNCAVHGEYRTYESLIVKKITIIKIGVAFLFYVLALTLNYLSISLNWLYLFMGIIVGPCVIPLSLSLFWARINSKAMFYSVLISCLLGIISWLITAGAYYGSITMETTGNLISMLVGNVVSIGLGGLICTVLTLFTNTALNVDQIGEIWEKTRDIDSPLQPWTEYFAKELNIKAAHKLGRRPPLIEIEKPLSKAKTIFWIVSIGLTIIFIFVIPLLMIAFLNFEYSAFISWIIFGQICALAGFGYILLGPIIESVMHFKDSNNVVTTEVVYFGHSENIHSPKVKI